MSHTLTFAVPGKPALPAHIANAIRVTTSGCWEWQNAVSDDGYGWTSLNNRTHQAHRLVYELMRGPIPDGLVLDQAQMERERRARKRGEQ